MIAYLDGSEPTSPAAVHVIDTLVRSGRNAAVVSMVTAMEILIRPLRGSRTDYLHAVDFLTHHPNLRAQPIDLAIAQEAASVRASFKLSAPDALIVATGLLCQVGHVVTNDERWRSVLKPIQRRINVVCFTNHLPW